MSMSKLKQPTYEDGRTKQSFKNETDINKILERAQKTGTISHLAKYEAKYGDFSNYDFFGNQLMLANGREMFSDLPSEIRNEFNQSPAAFFQYVTDPENSGRLDKLLPALAAPGKQNISTSPLVNADDTQAALAADQPKPGVTPTPTPATPPVAPNASTEPPPAS